MIQRYGIVGTIEGVAPPSSVNYDTGALTIPTPSVRRIRAIVFDRSSLPQIEEDLTLIATNRQYTFGGLFDLSTKDLLISGRLLKGFPLRLDCRVNISNEVLKVAKIVNAGESGAIWLRCVTSNEQGARVIHLTLGNALRLEAEIDNPD